MLMKSFSFLIFLLASTVALPCSMYKLTVDGKTMVGCNEDAWRTTSNIWFENATSSKGYGIACTGSRFVGNKKYAPQSGMNEKGLVYSRLTAFFPEKEQPQGLIPIQNEVDYLSSILHQCASVGEVKEFVSKYDRTFFQNDVFIYIDSTGSYLIVEPYELIEGNDPTYFLANFCPSVTDKETARKIERYRKGEDYVASNKPEANLRYCSKVSHEMAVCRNKKGDGTLLTSIWDTKNRNVNLFFYHQYDSSLQFNLAEELAKGDQLIFLPELLPTNKEFEALGNYITPFNAEWLRITLVLMAILLGLLSLQQLVSFVKSKGLIKLGFIGLNILMVAYLFVMATDMYIYYFDAPYVHFRSILISLSSYIPYVLVAFAFPTIYFLVRYFRSQRPQPFLKTGLILNSLVYALLLVGIGYWGLI
jgi:hypothetical protein